MESRFEGDKAEGWATGETAIVPRQEMVGTELGQRRNGKEDLFRK